MEYIVSFNEAVKAGMPQVKDLSAEKKQALRGAYVVALTCNLDDSLWVVRDKRAALKVIEVMGFARAHIMTLPEVRSLLEPLGYQIKTVKDAAFALVYDGSVPIEGQATCETAKSAKWSDAAIGYTDDEEGEGTWR